MWGYICTTMSVLLCLFILLCCHSYAHSIPTNISLVPIGDHDGGNNQTGMEATCSEVECPELKCEKTIQEEGKCCKSCDNSGGCSYIYVVKDPLWILDIVQQKNITKWPLSDLSFYGYGFTGQLLNLTPDPFVTWCVVGERIYKDLSLVPSTNTSDPCEVCHCCVSVHTSLVIFTISCLMEKLTLVKYLVRNYYYYGCVVI